MRMAIFSNRLSGPIFSVAFLRSVCSSWFFLSLCTTERRHPRAPTCLLLEMRLRRSYIKWTLIGSDSVFLQHLPIQQLFALLLLTRKKMAKSLMVSRHAGCWVFHQWLNLVKCRWWLQFCRWPVWFWVVECPPTSRSSSADPPSTWLLFHSAAGRVWTNSSPSTLMRSPCRTTLPRNRHFTEWPKEPRPVEPLNPKNRLMSTRAVTSMIRSCQSPLSSTRKAPSNPASHSLLSTGKILVDHYILYLILLHPSIQAELPLQWSLRCCPW